MRNGTNTRRTAGWITAAMAASAVFGLAGVTASVATADSVAAAFAGASRQSAAQRAGYDWSGGNGQSSSGSSSNATQATTAATAGQQKGVVVIDTDLAYEGSEAAGTGIVLTSSGEIVTNNHVVDGSTSITVTVPSTGATYTASVVGTDATDDIAVLQLKGASGLATATLDDDGGVAVGDIVTAVGNAGGTGSLVAAEGTVTGTNASITTQAEGVVASESLTGLIETNADIEAGDSGGPLFDSEGEVVGIDTAASASRNVSDGYAIPIRTALGIANQIESGEASSTVTIGLPAFFGVEVASDAASSGYTGSGGSDLGGLDLGYGYEGGQNATQGAPVGGVIDGTPAASAGLAAGDTITAVDGTAIASPSDLTSALAQHKPGDSVTISWVDSAGAAHSASVTLTSGPAA